MFLACAFLGAIVAGGIPDTLEPEEPIDVRFPVELLWDLGEDAEGAAFMDALDWMRGHPLDLNRASAADLLAIPRVTTAGAAAVLSFREGGGRFRAVEDLRSLPGGGEMLYEALRPFVAVAPRGAGALRTRDLIVQRAPGDAQAIGPNLEVLTRLALESRSGIEVGAALSRRGGERMADALVSAYASVTGGSLLTRVIAGDFDVESGGGVALWRGPAAAGVSRPVEIAGTTRLTPHRGPDRGHYLRGLAASFSCFDGLQGALFVSNRSYAATVDSSGDASAFFAGTYSTPASASKNNALHELLAGFALECPMPGGVSAGVTGYASRFDRTFVPSEPGRLRGNSADACGVHISWSGERAGVLGEWGVIQGGARALTWSAAMPLPGGESAELRYCDFPPGFDNPHAAADGELGESRNLRSVSALLRFGGRRTSGTEWRIIALERPAPTRASPIPRRSLEVTAIWKFAPPAGGLVTLRSSLRRSYDCSSGSDSMGRSAAFGGEASEHRMIACVSSPPASGVTLAERCEIVRVTSHGSGVLAGVLLGVELSARVPLRGVLEGRFSLFRTDGYAARLYDREEAVPGVLSAPPLYGRGTRWHVSLRVHPAPGFELICRYAATAADRTPGDGLVTPHDAGEFALQLDATL